MKEIVGPVKIVDAVQANGTTVIDVSDSSCTKWVFQSSGTFSATVQMQGTVDDAPTSSSTLANIGAALSTSGTLVQYEGVLSGIACDVSSYASGSVTVTVKGVGP